jgi:hypothetical protein
VYLLNLEALLAVGSAVALCGSTALLLDDGRSRGHGCGRIGHIDVGHGDRKLVSKLILIEFFVACTLGEVPGEKKIKSRACWRKRKVNGGRGVGLKIGRKGALPGSTNG